jgi:ferric-dicitrate binding protein FerR (iron transport regulator)
VSIASRHWRTWDDPEDADEYWRERQAEQEAAYDAATGWPAEVEDARYNARRERNDAESPRRQKLFRRAGRMMAVMVALRGVYGSDPTITAWYGRHGRRLGLFTPYDDDHEIQWTPRRGFCVRVLF